MKGTGMSNIGSSHLVEDMSGVLPLVDGTDSSEELIDLIDEIDLTMVKMKLCDADDGPGWSPERAAVAEICYKRYLKMVAAVEPSVKLVPTKEIDTVWHQHILDTRAYADDCERVFGRFLHHFPYFGLRGPEDAHALAEAYNQTANLHLTMFGESYSSSSSWCGSTGCTGPCHD